MCEIFPVHTSQQIDNFYLVDKCRVAGSVQNQKSTSWPSFLTAEVLNKVSEH